MFVLAVSTHSATCSGIDIHLQGYNRCKSNMQSCHYTPELLLAHVLESMQRCTHIFINVATIMGWLLAVWAPTHLHSITDNDDHYGTHVKTLAIKTPPFSTADVTCWHKCSPVICVNFGMSAPMIQNGAILLFVQWIGFRTPRSALELGPVHIVLYRTEWFKAHVWCRFHMS